MKLATGGPDLEVVARGWSRRQPDRVASDCWARRDGWSGTRRGVSPIRLSRLQGRQHCTTGAFPVRRCGPQVGDRTLESSTHGGQILVAIEECLHAGWGARERSSPTWSAMRPAWPRARRRILEGGSDAVPRASARSVGTVRRLIWWRELLGLQATCGRLPDPLIRGEMLAQC